MSTLRYIDAIRTALDIELRRDPSVVALGEDVTYGGPFGATKGLADTYGTRIKDTPISEATVMGLTVGAALSGLRPVMEVMYIDFITLAMDQLVNHGAKLRYMTDGLLQVPMVIRAQGGARGSMGAHHSQSLEAWFAHVPGLTVVAPSTPADAQGLLQSAIRSDDPVLYLEHRGLYWQKGEVPDGDDAALVPIGRAIVRRAGSDVTIASWSHMMGAALAAADQLAADGIEAEVIDLRSLLPLDLDALLGSVGRTGRLVIAHEAVTQGGLGAEIAAQVQERAWAELAAPIARVGAPFVPPPFAPELERAFVPDVDAIVAAARRVLDTPSRAARPSPQSVEA
ncbi:MAG: alpha-ketoacid dehydrogenase subunit beta [Chloroflexi bacterium]|nr:alpha-ketoacid dehydrogenase subunit beta [Chloroflexota bacterium]